MKYKIGDFSKITKISNRMLRYLDHEGILKPSFVDDNGYRYYSNAELETASEMIRLKKYLFSYDEIKEILSKGQERDQALLNNQLIKLKGIVRDYDKLIAELEQAYLVNDNKMVNRYDVQVMNRGAFYALHKRSVVKQSELERFIEVHVSQIYEQPIMLLGHYFLVFYNSDVDEASQFEVGFYQPIDKLTQVGDFETILLDDAICISTMHFGCYNEIYKGYKGLYQWADENGYVVVGDFSEKYYVDSHLTSNQHGYVTEISVIVLKK